MSAAAQINYVDIAEAHEFLKLVTPEGVQMNLCAFHPTNDGAAGFAYTRETIAATAEFLWQHAAWNLYWSPNPLKSKLDKKATKADVFGMRWAFADRDDPSEAARAVIEAVSPPATVLLFSGGGWQAFWQLRETVPSTYVDPDHPGNVPDLEATNIGVLQAVGEPDQSTHNIDRIMRLPGTTNWPTPAKLKKNPNRKPARARLIWAKPEREYALADLPRGKVTAAKPKAKADKDKSVDQSADLMSKIREDVFDGATDARVHADYADHPHVLSLAPSQRSRAIDRCIKKARAALAKVGAMNATHAVVWIGDKLRVMWRNEWNGQLPRLASVGDMRIECTNQGAVFADWLRSPSRAQYSKIVFEPGKVRTPGTFNLWRGFAVKPKPGDCPLFLKMVKECICSGDEALFRYVMAWCADLVQNPDVRTGISLVLRGKPGTGKGTFFHAIGSLLGNHYTYVYSPGHLVGKFNAHIATALLVFADEAVFAGDRRTDGVLKAMITEPKLTIEGKGKDVINITNHIRVGMASNQDWVVSTEMEDRRFAIIDVSPIHRNQTAYFTAVQEELTNGGREALLDHLLTFDLTGVDLRDIPKTDARLDQQVLSLDTERRWWLDMLQSEGHEPVAGMRMGWRFGGVVTPSRLHESYLHHCTSMRAMHPLSLTQFGIKIVREFLPDMPPKREATAQESTDWSIEARKRVYVLPTLAEARQQFEKLLGRPVPWTASDSDADGGM